MEISAISSTSYVNRINWNQLTAKQIMNYDKQGVDVPDQYLQWAKEFINNIETQDNDDTTYETAQSESSNATDQTNNTENTDGTNETDETQSDDGTSDVNGNSETEELNQAQQKRKQLEASGMSLEEQAESFTTDSDNLSNQNEQIRTNITAIESTSNTDIQNLDSYMEQLISQIEEKQNETKENIEKINSNSNDKTLIQKVNEAQNELNQFGIQGQALSAITYETLNSYGTMLNGFSTDITTTQEFGTETVSVGNELLDSVSDNIFEFFKRITAEKAIDSGNNALDSATETLSAQTEAISINSSNITAASSYQADIASRTGVQAMSISSNKQTENTDNTNNTDDTNNKIGSNENSNNSTNNGDNTDKLTSEKNQLQPKESEENNKVIKDEDKKKEDIKDGNNSEVTNTQLEQDKISAGELDYLLKRKIRRGENINE